MPHVSVVIPAYNVEKTIAETIQSVLNQSFSDFELIIINDGSTDSTVEVVRQILDSRIKIYSFENAGLPEARNRGIRHAIGKFVTFVDADDLWTPDKIEDQLDALQTYPEAGVAYSWTAFIDEHSQFLYAGEPFPHHGNVYPQLLVKNFIASGSNIMIRREVIDEIGEYDATLKSAEDWDYNVRLAARYPFARVPKYQVLYRKSSTSMTAKVDVMEQAILTVINRGFQTAPDELQFLKNQALSNTYRFFTKLCLDHVSGNEGVKKARKNYVKSIRLYPKSLLKPETPRIGLKILINMILPKQLSRKILQFLGRNFPLVSKNKHPVKEEVR
ncbi:MAG TPA: glycosyltransferase family 2 protein [Elainellaceae cyanobacterium]